LRACGLETSPLSVSLELPVLLALKLPLVLLRRMNDTPVSTSRRHCQSWS